MPGRDERRARRAAGSNGRSRRRERAEARALPNALTGPRQPTRPPAKTDRRPVQRGWWHCVDGCCTFYVKADDDEETQPASALPVASARPDQNPPRERASQSGPEGSWPTGARWRVLGVNPGCGFPAGGGGAGPDEPGRGFSASSRGAADLGRPGYFLCEGRCGCGLVVV